VADRLHLLALPRWGSHRRREERGESVVSLLRSSTHSPAAASTFPSSSFIRFSSNSSVVTM